MGRRHVLGSADSIGEGRGLRFLQLAVGELPGDVGDRLDEGTYGHRVDGAGEMTRGVDGATTLDDGAVDVALERPAQATLGVERGGAGVRCRVSRAVPGRR